MLNLERFTSPRYVTFDGEYAASREAARRSAEGILRVLNALIVAHFRERCAADRGMEKLDAGLSLQRIWQDLVEEFGYAASYESAKRFVAHSRDAAPCRRSLSLLPGAEAQVDFFRGAPTLHPETGEWRRP